MSQRVPPGGTRQARPAEPRRAAEAVRAARPAAARVSPGQTRQSNQGGDTKT
jgi:hypothetical protein